MVAQDEFCGFDAMLQEEMNNPELSEEFQQRYLSGTCTENEPNLSGGIYTIPTVFHIIHNNGPENISDEAVNDLILELNDAFRNVAQGNGVDTKIEFRLAQLDPLGCPTDGIERHEAIIDVNTHPEEAAEFFNSIRWPEDNYFNIRILKEYSGCGLGSVNGVVLDYDCLYTNPYPQLITHETGHYLSLLHTWGNEVFGDPSQPNGCTDNNCCFDGDQVCDTPPTHGPHNITPCIDDFVDTCPDDDEFDLIRNYMSYSRCKSEFTAGQRDRMYFELNVRRKKLWAKENLVYTGVENQTIEKDVMITQNTVWTTNNLPNNGEIFLNSLTVKQGVTLTIDAGVIVHFYKGECTLGQAIIEKDAKLILRGTLTNRTDYGTWDGVKVSGALVSELFDLSVQSRGIFQGEAGAKIENATIGIENKASVDGSTIAGGIIQCDGVTFDDNSIGVRFSRFLNTDFPPVNPIYYVSSTPSYFNNCTFMGYNFSFSDTEFHSHIYIDGVRGIEIGGTTSFRADAFDDSEWRKWGYGIYAIDGGFSVEGNCTFNDLWRGIYAVNATSNQAFSVRNAYFDGCQIGIFNKGVSFASILHNEFILGNRPNQFSETFDDQIGVILKDNMAGLAIEENTFVDDALGLFDVQNTIGICTESLGGSNNQIRRNTFTDANFGNVSSGASPGLQYLCNSNTGIREIDFSVTNGEINFTQSGQDEVGTVVAAGNTFSYNASPPEDDFLNHGSFFNYLFDPAATNQEPAEYSTNTILLTLAPTNNCPQNHFNSPIVCDKELMFMEFNTHKGDWLNYKAIYAAQLDNGNTDMLVEDIENASTMQEATVIQTTCTNISPWISEKVFRALTDRTDLFSNQALHSLLQANSSVVRTTSIMAYIQHTRPDYDLSITPIPVPEREELKRRIEYHRQQMTDYGNRIIRCIAKERELDFNELQQWLWDMQTYGTDLMYVKNLLQTNNYLSALTTMDIIPDRYELLPKDLTTHGNYKDLLVFLINAHQGGTPAHQLSNEALSTLQDINNTTNGIVKQTAANILYAHKAIALDENCALPSNLQNRSTTNEGKKIEDKAAFSIYPNPAHQELTIQWDNTITTTAAQENKDVIFKIFNINGTLAQSTALPNTKGQQQLDISNLSNGIYFYYIHLNQQLEQGKLIIQH